MSMHATKFDNINNLIVETKIATFLSVKPNLSYHFAKADPGS
jgi:hypothetical protein